MLSASFFISVFASVIWVFYVLSNNTEAGINDFVVTTAVIVLPIFILWAIFGYVYQYISASVLNKNMYSLFKQMKKNQDYSDLIAKILLEARQDARDDTILNKFEIFIADINELLSEIILRGHLASSEHIDNLWVKVKNGGRWAFGKVIIELNQNQPNLPNRLLQKALQDVVLGGTILEFCSRYQSLISALEKHDKERMFLNVVETGVLGKVFSLLAGPADSIRQNRELTLTHSQMTEEKNEEYIQENVIETILPSSLIEKKEDVKENSISENARRLFINTFNRRKKEEDTVVKEEPKIEDPLSLAFAKSFGSSDTEEIKIAEPFFEQEDGEQEENMLAEQIEETIEELKEEEQENVEEVEETEEVEVVSAITSSIENGFLSSQEKLASIKKEWEEAKQRDLSVNNSSEDEGMPEPKINSNDDEYSYPFGGWTNADNYNK